MSGIAQHLEAVRRRIRTACERCGRSPESVQLVAVSKTRPAQDILAAFQAGQTIFGENYVQELCAKMARIHEPLQWHFIGHLQSNKVRQIAGQVSLIHSVDRLSLAQELSRQWGRLGMVCNLLVQVNVSGEASKSGTTASEALELVREIALLPNLQVQGLMTMPPFLTIRKRHAHFSGNCDSWQTGSAENKYLVSAWSSFPWACPLILRWR